MDTEERPENITDIVSFNAGHAELTVSGFLLLLTVFDIAKDPTKPGQIATIPRITIGLPWPLAKTLSQLLPLAIHAYEAQEGTISVPNSVADSITKQTNAMNEGTQSK